MFKFIIVLVIIIFILSKLFKFLLKYAFIGMAQKHGTGNFDQRGFARKQNTNAADNSKDKKSHTGRNGGDYIEYEVVK